MKSCEHSRRLPIPYRPAVVTAKRDEPLPTLRDASDINKSARGAYILSEAGGKRDLTLLAAQWMEEGLPPELPCALVSHAAQPDQQIVHTTLRKLGEAAQASAPSLLLAGWALQSSAQRDAGQQLESVSNSGSS